MSLFEGAADTPFKNRNALKEKYVPEKIVGREAEKEEYRNQLLPLLDGDTPDNTFLIGPPGVGKTSLTRYVLEDLKRHAPDTLTVCRVNCDGVGGETTLMLEIANQLRGPDEDDLSLSGYKKAVARNKMMDALGNRSGLVLLVLDEIDAVEGLDTFVYQISREHETGKLDDGTDLAVIGISNDQSFLGDLPADVKGTLAEERIHFSEYEADELRAVLRQRAALAFKDTEVVDTGGPEPELESDTIAPEVVPLIAAYAGRNSGEARMAIQLLKVSGDIARRHGDTFVDEDHVRTAMEKYERDEVTEYLQQLKGTARYVLYATVTLVAEVENDAHPREDFPRTVEIIERYQQLVGNTAYDTVSNRQVRSHLSKLDNMGITEAVVQKGGTSGTFTTRSLQYATDVVYRSIPDVVDEIGTHRSVERYAGPPAMADSD